MQTPELSPENSTEEAINKLRELLKDGKLEGFERVILKEIANRNR